MTEANEDVEIYEAGVDFLLILAAMQLIFFFVCS